MKFVSNVDLEKLRNKFLNLSNVIILNEQYLNMYFWDLENGSKDNDLKIF